MTEQKMIKKLNAFYVFGTSGIEMLKQLYPAEIQFVQENAEKNYEDVREQLLSVLNQK